MRLKKIKLAGFKSFVDPTTVHLPGSLTGIVGPNGCGKSNLIDAVRWVMGESSAKQLRGDSLADVIFNGSTSRKPVGQASIELVFDNSSGRLGGEYARYAEIAVRRLLSRDGQSIYYLNGTRCRRRDITDIFLGTGLGPRSYAIIEQGMISRIVEAGPEQMRQVLEEAAGISKYKERRKETESRIAHTRENLNRINDLRDELGKQLEKLQRQAKNAERFKILKARERELRAGLLALRWRSEENAAKRAETDSQTVALELEKQIAQQTGVESRLEEAREILHVANEAMSEIQARFYNAGAEVARVEQAIRHERDIGHQRREELARLERARAEVAQHIASDGQRISELEEYLREHTPQLAKASAVAEEARERLHVAEQDLSRWRDAYDDLQSRMQEPQRIVHVERTRIDYHERQLIQLQERRSRVMEEQASVSDGADEPRLSLLLARESELSRQLAELEAKTSALDLEEQSLRVAERATELQLNASRDQQRQCRGRLASLETLQENALGRADGVRETWLSEHGLETHSRLGESLQVEPGWELAVESVLGIWLEGIRVEALAEFAADVESCGDSLILYESAPDVASAVQTHRQLVPLAEKVPDNAEVLTLLRGVYASPTLDEALQLRAMLEVGECLVTAQGTRVGPTWIILSRDRDASESVLVRAREMEKLKAEVAALDSAVTGAESELAEMRTTTSGLEMRRRALHKGANELHRRHAELETEINASQAQMEQLERRRSTLDREQSEIEKTTAEEREGLSQARKEMEGALAAVAVLEDERRDLETRRQEVEQRAVGCRLEVRTVGEQVSRLQLDIESRRSTLDSVRKSCERQRQQQEGLETQIEKVAGQLSESEAPTAALELQREELLLVRGNVEDELQAARVAVEEAEAHLREVDRERLAIDQATSGVREKLEQHRLAAGEARARCQAVAEQMADTGMDLQNALRMAEEDAGSEAWPEELAQTERRIQRLGAINLAAIEEYAQESERKQYLDAQHADLTEALETLELAMRRIDRETRSRFQSMFDRINEGLTELFPRLFGGGQAFLQLTGEDVLDAGVTIMARPPGKRISNIHLLSGGEKALTAISLVFTIFQLNPAPFCMLDEVDAPLDEANVGRYSALVSEMSEKVQLIVITHNKTTMETVEHLMGVTMHEPGCSRLVSVDVGEAARLAAV